MLPTNRAGKEDKTKYRTWKKEPQDSGKYSKIKGKTKY